MIEIVLIMSKIIFNRFNSKKKKNSQKSTASPQDSNGIWLIIKETKRLLDYENKIWITIILVNIEVIII